MPDVSLMRLYTLRAAYLLIVISLGSDIWPSLLFHQGEWKVANSVVVSMLGGFALACALGIRYPLKMLPLLLFELVWKAIWLVAVGLPQRRTGNLDAGMQETMFACLVGLVICLVAIPWRFIFSVYIKAAGDRWKPAKKQPSPGSGGHEAPRG